MIILQSHALQLNFTVTKEKQRKGKRTFLVFLVSFVTHTTHTAKTSNNIFIEFMPSNYLTHNMIYFS